MNAGASIVHTNVYSASHTALNNTCTNLAMVVVSGPRVFEQPGNNDCIHSTRSIPMSLCSLQFDGDGLEEDPCDYHDWEVLPCSRTYRVYEPTRFDCIHACKDADVHKALKRAVEAYGGVLMSCTWKGDVAVHKGHEWTMCVEIYEHHEATCVHINVLSSESEEEKEREQCNDVCAKPSSTQVDDDVEDRAPDRSGGREYRVVEVQKRSGCTMAFWTFYRYLLRTMRDVIRKEYSNVSLDGSARVGNGMFDHMSGFCLPECRDKQIEELEPICAMMESSWSDAQREGCRLCARICDKDENVLRLCGHQNIIDMLLVHLHSKDRHTVRCAAYALSRMVQLHVLDARFTTSSEPWDGHMPRRVSQELDC